MIETLSAVAGLAGGLILGIAITCIAKHHTNPYGSWLGRKCWVRPLRKPEWREHAITAVSWKGAVCVREIDRLGEDGYWIKKENVPFRVLFDKPREER